MSLLHRTTREGYGQRLRNVVLDDSKTFTNGDVSKLYDQTDGAATYVAAAQPVFGVQVGIVDKYGNAIPVVTVTPGTATSTVETAIATGASNVSGKVYFGKYITSEQSIFTATVNGTLGTTNNSEFAGARLDVDSSGTSYGRLLETTATRTIGTPANFYSHGKDPNDATRLLVNIAMSEYRSTME